MKPCVRRPAPEHDRVLAGDIEALAGAVRAGAFNAWCDRTDSGSLHRRNSNTEINSEHY